VRRSSLSGSNTRSRGELAWVRIRGKTNGKVGKERGARRASYPFELSSSALAYSNASAVSPVRIEGAAVDSSRVRK